MDALGKLLLCAGWLPISPAMVVGKPGCPLICEPDVTPLALTIPEAANALIKSSTGMHAALVRVPTNQLLKTLPISLLKTKNFSHQSHNILLMNIYTHMDVSPVASVLPADYYECISTFERLLADYTNELPMNPAAKIHASYFLHVPCTYPVYRLCGSSF